jgi:hypothetical protein
MLNSMFSVVCKFEVGNKDNAADNTCYGRCGQRQRWRWQQVTSDEGNGGRNNDWATRMTTAGQCDNGTAGLTAADCCSQHGWLGLLPAGRPCFLVCEIWSRFLFLPFPHLYSSLPPLTMGPTCLCPVDKMKVIVKFNSH